MKLRLTRNSMGGNRFLFTRKSVYGCEYVRTKRSDYNTFLWTIGKKALLWARFHPYHMCSMAE